jgi:hypothetical protein
MMLGINVQFDGPSQSQWGVRKGTQDRLAAKKDEFVFSCDGLSGSQDMLDLGALHTFGKSPDVRPA